MNNKLLNGRAKEIFKELFEKHSMYLEYQNKLKINFNVFYCPECEEIHDISEKVKGTNYCRTGYNKSKGRLMKQTKERRKQALAK